MENEILQDIFIRFSKALYLYALSLTHHPQDAEDLVSETFLKAYLSYNGKSDIQYWLFRTLKNLFIDEYRKKKKIVHDEGDLLENIEDPNIPLRQLFREQQEQHQWLYSRIYRMKPLERDVLLLTMNSGMKDEEIADVLGISVSNLRVIRHRTKEMLKKEVKENGYE